MFSNNWIKLSTTKKDKKGKICRIILNFLMFLFNQAL